jgi:hypothetical protein
VHKRTTRHNNKNTLITVLNRNTTIYTLNVKEWDNSKIYTSSNPILSVCLLIMFDTLFLRPTLHLLVKVASQRAGQASKISRIRRNLVLDFPAFWQSFLKNKGIITPHTSIPQPSLSKAYVYVIRIHLPTRSDIRQTARVWVCLQWIYRSGGWKP